MLAKKAQSMAQRTLHSPKFTGFNEWLNPMLCRSGTHATLETWHASMK
jgi:hypothetical protein